MNETMSPRERVLAALAHQPTDRVPFSWGFGINLPARKKLAEYMGLRNPEDLDTYLPGFSDIRKVNADYCGPSCRNRVEKSGLQVDIWGVGRAAHNYGEGSYDEISQYPLAGITDISELDSYEWPSPDWFDVRDLKAKIAQANQDRPHAIQIANGNIFETSWYMRGFEQTLMDLIIEPELVWEIMTRVTDFYISYFKKMLDAAEGMVDIVFTADDIGQQQGLLLSLDLWERMIKPHHRRLNKTLHDYGVKILYHSDGAVMDAVPGLIDMGIDILEALQFDASGMNPEKLKSAYGDKLCFHGGISVQSTLPFGTADDVRQEVKERIRVLGQNGGYILAPSHAIQAGTPPENIVALIESIG